MAIHWILPEGCNIIPVPTMLKESNGHFYIAQISYITDPTTGKTKRSSLTIAKFAGGKGVKFGRLIFTNDFLKDNPSFKNYDVERVGKGTLKFTPRDPNAEPVASY